MDTSNRQGREGVGETGEVTVMASERIAVVANLKKVGCDELTPQEWVELIDIAIVHAKPHFKYLPSFLPAISRTFSRFYLHRCCNSTGDHFQGSWSNEKFICDLTPESDGMLKAFIIDCKVIEICEVSGSEGIQRSLKFLMSDKGMFFRTHCYYEEMIGIKHRFNGTPTVESVEVVWKDDWAAMIKDYPQIGPRTLFAISHMVNATYAEKLRVLEGLNFVGKKLQAICGNVNLGDGHYVQKNPWGVSYGID